MSQPLSDIKVLDLSRLLPGPYCSLLLADMGADVVRVEAPGQGDLVRWMPPLVDGMGAAFVALNRGKKSLTLNLRSDAGLAAFRRLSDRFDVLIESFRPGVMARLGLDYETLSKTNPGLVYCSISGYGQTGPMSERAGHDINYLALSGVLGATGPKGRPPQLSAVQIADIAGGSYPAALGIVAALFERSRTGHGQFLDISMTDGALAMMLIHLAGPLADGGAVTPGELALSGGLVNYQAYETRDGKAIALGALEPKFWLRFVEKLGRPELAELAQVEGEELERARGIMRELFASKTRDEWVAILGDIDACCEPILDMDETLNFPLHWSRGMIREVEVPGQESARVVVSPLPFGREEILEGACGEIETLPAAPRLGEHGQEVLLANGFSNEEIEVLRSEAGL